MRKFILLALLALCAATLCGCATSGTVENRPGFQNIREDWNREPKGLVFFSSEFSPGPK